MFTDQPQTSVQAPQAGARSKGLETLLSPPPAKDRGLAGGSQRPAVLASYWPESWPAIGQSGAVVGSTEGWERAGCG